MTNRDYPGTTYYTIRNVSLYECLGWCRDEVDCSSASFSFVVNPLAPLQETTCRLQNESAIVSPSPSSKLPSSSSSSSQSSSSLTSSSPSSVNSSPSPIAPQKAVNLYYFTKTHLRSGKYRHTQNKPLSPFLPFNLYNGIYIYINLCVNHSENSFLLPVSFFRSVFFILSPFMLFPFNTTTIFAPSNNIYHDLLIPLSLAIILPLECGIGKKGESPMCQTYTRECIKLCTMSD